MTRHEDHLQPETLAIVSGRSANEGSLSTPLWATTVYEAETAEQVNRLSTTAKPAAFYSRHGNPTVNAFEEAVATLEGAEAAQAFASGMGAVSSVALALCSQGNHVVAARQIYSVSSILLQSVLPRFGVEVTFVDGTDAAAIAAAVEPGRTVLLLVETPANPVMQLVDLDALGSIVGPIKVVDSTFAGPLVQRPLDHGIDLVLHSATKSLAGHNDATLGVVAGDRDLIEAVWAYHTIHGAVASPFDALNGLRGIRTLGVRMRQQCASAQSLAELLEDHPRVRRVNYPGLDSHPQRDIAKRQMTAGGGVLSFEVTGGAEAGRRFVESTRLARLAPSLGGPETLVTHPASSTAVNLTAEERVALGISEGLVRVSLGLEHTDDILADVSQALAAL